MKINSINIYPNPTDKNITLNVNSETKKDLLIEIFNVTGQLVKKQVEFLNIGNNKLKATLDLLPRFYSLVLTGNNLKYSSKLIIN